MKKSKKKILIIAAVAFTAVIAVILIVTFPLLSMAPAETGKIAGTEIIAVKNNINSLFFIESSDGYILIDAGSGMKNIESTMKEQNIDPSSVKHILLTHSDSDHVGTLSLFTNAKIYMSEDELQMINGQAKRNATGGNSLPEFIEHDALILLKDEQELAIGEHKIKCIKVPGHTLGSMAYVVDGDYLFTGDSCRVSGNTLDVHPFTMDAETSKKSIQKLYEIMKETKLTITAHYGWYKSDDIKLSS